MNQLVSREKLKASRSEPAPPLRVPDRLQSDPANLKSKESANGIPRVPPCLDWRFAKAQARLRRILHCAAEYLLETQHAIR